MKETQWEVNMMKGDPVGGQDDEVDSVGGQDDEGRPSWRSSR